MKGFFLNNFLAPVGGRGGISWSSYWATLISATVENAAPTHVVLTFPAAQTSLTDTDFTIAGFTISSASWTGAILTLVLSDSVLVFNGNLIITFARTGTTAIVTNNVVDDGNTVAWYDASALTTITKDVNNRISQWADKLSSGNDLLQATANLQPLLITDEIQFAGDSLQTADFIFAQPITIYAVIMPDSWGNFRKFIEGSTPNVVAFTQTTATPQMKVLASTNLGNVNVPVGEYSIIRIVFNGANSKVQVDDLDPVSGNAGTNAMGGITIGSQADGATQFGYFRIKEAIFRKTTDTAPIESTTFNYLALKHGLVVIGLFTMAFPFVLA